LAPGLSWGEDQASSAEEQPLAAEEAPDDAEPAPSLAPRGWYPSFSIGMGVYFENDSYTFGTDSIPTLGVTEDWPERSIPPQFYPYCPDSLPPDCAPGTTAPRSYSSQSSGSVRSEMIMVSASLYAPIVWEEVLDLRPFLFVEGQLPTRISHTLNSYTANYQDELAAIPVRGTTSNTTLCVPNYPTGLPCDTLPNGEFRKVDKIVFANATQESIKVGFVGNWFLGLGLDLTLPFVGDRHLSFRPSVSYFGQRVKYEAYFFTKEFPNPTNPFGEFSQEDNGVPVMILSGNHYKTLQGVAPGFALDMLLGRRGPIGISLYAEYRAMVVLSDRSVEFEVPNSAPDFAGQGSGRYTFSTNQLHQQLGVGFRVSWIGGALSGD